MLTSSIKKWFKLCYKGCQWKIQLFNTKERCQLGRRNGNDSWNQEGSSQKPSSQIFTWKLPSISCDILFSKDHLFVAEAKSWNLWPGKGPLEADILLLLDPCHVLWCEAFASVKCIVCIWFTFSVPCRCLIWSPGSWGSWSVFAAHDPRLPFPPIFPSFSSYFSLMKLSVKTNKQNPLFVLFWLY